MLIGRHSEIAVRMPNPINKLLNDESIAVQMLFLDGYTWNKPWIRWNTGLIGDGSDFNDILWFFFMNNVVEIIHTMSNLYTHNVALTVSVIIIMDMVNACGLRQEGHPVEKRCSNTLH